MIKELINKNTNDFIILDGILQWALNPTSMSAGYGIEENYPYIERNIKITHELSSEEAKNKIKILKSDFDKLTELRQDKYDIGNFQKIIIEELSKRQIFKLFLKFIEKRKKKASKNAIDFLNIYKNCPVKNYPCLNVQYHAIYGIMVPENELIHLGILKNLQWISSGSSGKREITPILVPFLDKIVEKMKLKKWTPKEPNVRDFLNSKIKTHDIRTLNFFKKLYKRQELYILEKKSTINPTKGFIGICQSLDPDYEYIGISFLIQEQLYNLINDYIKMELIEKTQKIVKFLKYEIDNREIPSDKELIREFGIYIDEIEEFKNLVDQLPFESFSDNQIIINNATEAMRQFDHPSLYDLLNTLHLDIETARMVGKYLIDKKMINEFLRIPKDIGSSTPLKPPSKSSKRETIICVNCRTPLSDRENVIFCPFCGSSNLKKS